MKDLIFTIIIFILCYLFYLIFVLKRKNVLSKFKTGKELTYLKVKYKVNINDKNIKIIANTCFLANSFILALTVYVVCLFDNIIVEVLIGLFILLILILFIYHLIGTYYGKKSRR